MPIIKDTDTTISITVTDASGSAVDLSTLSGYVVEIFQKQIPFDQFSKNVQAGYRSVNETDPTNGVFEIYLNAGNTRKGLIGKEVFYELKTEATNANFDGGVEEKSAGIISLGDLIESETKDQTF